MTGGHAAGARPGARHTCVGLVRAPCVSAHGVSARQNSSQRGSVGCAHVGSSTKLQPSPPLRSTGLSELDSLGARARCVCQLLEKHGTKRQPLPPLHRMGLQQVA